jgi:hypothetical protein
VALAVHIGMVAVVDKAAVGTAVVVASVVVAIVAAQVVVATVVAIVVADFADMGLAAVALCLSLTTFYNNLIYPQGITHFLNASNYAFTYDRHCQQYSPLTCA